MNRKLTTLSTLIAVVIALFSTFTTHADESTSGSELHSVFVTNFTLDPNGFGEFTGAILSSDGDYYMSAIKFYSLDNKTMEDYFPSYGAMITATFDYNDRGMTGIMHAYSEEYHKTIDMGYSAYNDDSHIVGYVVEYDEYSTGTMDGQIARFGGFVHNGSIIKLRGANAYSVQGMGWLLQDTYLISYTVANDEEYTPRTRIFVPVVNS